jgi:hypothetical protein
VFQPLLEGKDLDIDYDSGEESDDVDEDDDDAFEDDDPFSNNPPPTENLEHSNPNSYSWCLMRYAVIRLAQKVLEKFINIAGVEMPGMNTLQLHLSSMCTAEMKIFDRPSPILTRLSMSRPSALCTRAPRSTITKLWHFFAQYLHHWPRI